MMMMIMIICVQWVKLTSVEMCINMRWADGGVQVLFVFG